MLVISILSTIGFVIFLRIAILKSTLEKKCTANDEGVVIKHVAGMGNIRVPLVEYEVNNKKYKKKLKYNKVIYKNSPLNPIKSSVGNGSSLLGKSLVLKANSFLSITNLIVEKFPVGSRMTVWYNPKNPKQAYVERVAESYTIFIVDAVIFLIISIFCYILSIAL